MLNEVTMARDNTKGEEILAGQNVKGNKDVIPFRTLENVRTTSTMIPPSSAEELIEVLKPEDSMKAFRFHPATVSSEVKLENDPYELASSSRAAKPEPVSPTSVPESLCTDDTPKKEPRTPRTTPRTSPAGSDTIIRPSKRQREAEDNEETESADSQSDHLSEDEYRDFSDPGECMNLFRRMRGTTLKVNWETQLSLKRLNQIHFTERARLVKKHHRPLHNRFVNVIANLKAKEAKNLANKLKKEKMVQKPSLEGEKLQNSKEGSQGRLE